MRHLIATSATVAGVTLAGCNLDLANPNNPTLPDPLTNPRAASSAMIVGVISTYRVNRADQIRAFGSFGRETYYMFVTDGRFITGPFRDWRQNNSFDAGTQWVGRYGNYRNAHAALALINQTTALTDAEKNGARGVLKTFIALDLLHVIEARGPIGAVVEMTDDINQIHPIVSQDSVYKWISNTLDEAKRDLDQAGPSFYFPIYNGFALGFIGNTPAGFKKVNRAIEARVEAKRGSLGCGATCYTAALAALDSTWIADLTAANRDDGVYAIYSMAAGDALNTVAFTGAVGSDAYVHPLIDSIAGVTLDNRYVRKIGACPSSSPRAEVGVSSSHRPCTYASTTTSIPILRNEELVLLRAEAEWFTGNGGGAAADLATIRTQSGGAGGGTSAVAFVTPANDAQFVTELLLQRTLSLYQEGQRFPDYRRFNRLASVGILPQDVTQGFTVATASVLSSQECDTRARVGAAAPMSCPGGAAVP